MGMLNPSRAPGPSKQRDMEASDEASFGNLVSTSKRSASVLARQAGGDERRCVASEDRDDGRHARAVVTSDADQTASFSAMTAPVLVGAPGDHLRAGAGEAALDASCSYPMGGNADIVWATKSAGEALVQGNREINSLASSNNQVARAEILALRSHHAPGNNVMSLSIVNGLSALPLAGDEMPGASAGDRASTAAMEVGGINAHIDAVAEIFGAIARASGSVAGVPFPNDGEAAVLASNPIEREPIAAPNATQLNALVSEDTRVRALVPSNSANAPQGIKWRGDLVREMDCRVRSESLGAMDVKLRVAAGAIDLSIAVSTPDAVTLMEQRRTAIMEHLRDSGLMPGLLDFSYAGSNADGPAEGSTRDSANRKREPRGQDFNGASPGDVGYDDQVSGKSHPSIGPEDRFF